MGSRANNLPDRPHRALRLGATPAHYYGGHAPRAGGCPARLPSTPTSLPYTPAPNTTPGSPTLYPNQPTLYPRLPNAAPARPPYTLPRYYIVNQPSTLSYYT